MVNYYGDKFRLKAKFSTGVAPYGVTGTPITAAIVGDDVAARFTITASHGTPPYVYALSSGTLPTGQSINSSTGLVSGVITAAATYSAIILKATDANNDVTYLTPYAVIVSTPASAFAITGTPTTVGTVGTAITNSTFFATGNTGSVVWSADASYPLPTGIVINSSTGVMSGTVTAGNDGTYRCRVTGNDNIGTAYSALFQMAIQAIGTVVTEQSVANQFVQRIVTGAADEVLSLHGGTWHERASTNPGTDSYGLDVDNLALGPENYSGAGQLPVNYYPIRGTNMNMRFRGGRVKGYVSRYADIYLWTHQAADNSGYKNSAGMLLNGSTANSYHVYGARIDHCWDGIQFYPTNGVTTNGVQPYVVINNLAGACHNYVDQCWISEGEDDCIENDYGLSLDVTDSLLEGQCLISAQIGANVNMNSHMLTDTITLTSNVMRVMSRVHTVINPTSPNAIYLAPMKLGDKSPALVCTGNVLALDGYPGLTATTVYPGNSRKGLWDLFWSRQTAAEGGSNSGNVFCWMLDTAPPATALIGVDVTLTPGTAGALPAGWIYKSGSTARDYYALVKATWIAAHPHVFRMDTDGAADATVDVNSPLIDSGDSWGSSFVSYTGANDNRNTRWGVLPALFEYSGHPWRITRLGHKAVSGTTSTQIVAQTTAAITTLPGGVEGVWICPERFLNDIATGKTAAQASADYDTDILAVRAANCRCIIGTCPPLRSDNTLTAPQIQKRLDFNTLVRAKAGPYVKVIDYDTFGLVDGDYVDTLHLTTNGWDRIAPYVRAAIYTWLPTTTPIKDVTATEYTDNPTMTGGNSTAPSGWTVDVANAGGATASWDTTTKRLTITGNYSGSSKYVEVSRVTSSAPLPAVADNVEMIVDYSVIGTPTSWLSIQPVGVIWNSGFSTLAATYGGIYAPGVAETAADMARPSGNYVIRTPQVPVASGTPFYRFTDLKIYLRDVVGSTAVSIVLQLNFVGLRKVA